MTVTYKTEEHGELVRVNGKFYRLGDPLPFPIEFETVGFRDTAHPVRWLWQFIDENDNRGPVSVAK